MSLLAFQQALCELIASPVLCIAVRSNPRVLEQYELTQRERDRLADVVSQRGMSTNCTLYRSNRITPIYTLLHYTCLVLGDQLQKVLDSYWSSDTLRDLEFKQETRRFASFLKKLIQQRVIKDDIVEEVLDLELAVNELRFAPRRKILRELQTRGAADNELHPLMRIVRFTHDPRMILDALKMGVAPKDLPSIESYVLLSRINDELEVNMIGVQLGRKLALAAKRAPTATPREAAGNRRDMVTDVPRSVV